MLILTLLSLLAAAALATAAFFWSRSREYQRVVHHNQRLQACVEVSGWAYYEIGQHGAMRWSGNAPEVLAAGEQPLPDCLEQWLLRIDSQHRDDMQQRYQDLLAGRTSPAREYILRHREGAEVICEDIAQPFRTGLAAAWEVVGFVRNATLMKALQQEAKQAKPIVSVGRIAGMIAHDLANVLSIIHGQSRLLASAQGPDSAGKLTSAIMAAAERGRQLCQQILFVARPRSEREGLRSAELIQELRTMLVGLAQPSISIETAVQDADTVIPGNSGRLLQALLNLCINAIEAMKDAGGTLTLRCTLVSNEAPFPSALGIVPVGSYVCFEISDTGDGIPQHLLSRIFAPGYSTKAGDAPRGLGLAIIASVLTEVGAFIDIESKTGTGTTFKVYLPHLHLLSEPANVLRSAKLGAGESILIMDFDEDNLLRLEDMLADIGYEPNAFSNCEEAMRSLITHQGYKAAVVADNVTLGDGTPFYEAIAQHMPSFKIILVGKTTHAMPKAAMSALVEPYTHSDIAAVLARVVSR